MNFWSSTKDVTICCEKTYGYDNYLLKENSSLFKEKREKELKKLKLFYPMIPKNHLAHRLKTYFKIKMYK